MPPRDVSQLWLPKPALATLHALLARHVPQAEVWAYGSRVTGSAHEGSDLDVVLRNPDDLALTTDGWFDLKEALQQSRLPMLVDVHDWCYLPASFQEEITQDYVVVQAGRTP